MAKAEIPLLHFQHLKRLATLRRCTLDEALDFVMAKVVPCGEDRLKKHFGESPELRKLDLHGHGRDEVLACIQGLPRNIRPVTDGPYLDEFRFLPEDGDLIGIEAEGVTVFDFKNRTQRDEEVFALVRDLLPEMSVEQYRLYSTFNSQYLRLVREPELFTMPRKPGIAIDAGCYVGYKALAMAQFTKGAPVLCFELLPEIFTALERNVARNPSFDIRPFCCALSDKRVSMPAFTRDQKSMANSLTSFGALKEWNTALGAESQVSQETQVVTTELLDDYTKDAERISCLHISVNGHEPEVLAGGGDTARRAEILRISAPYNRDDQPVRELVIKELQRLGVAVFGISGAAVIAGKDLNGYHAVPMQRSPSAGLFRLGVFHVKKMLRRISGTR